jgi:hypothetical protein
VPRYFFHVFDDCEFIKDEVGVDVTGPDEAKAELERVASVIPQRLRRPGTRATLYDESGAMLAEVWVSPQTKNMRQA